MKLFNRRPSVRPSSTRVPARRSAAQLRVERLEDRTVPNATSVFDAHGHLNTYVVHHDGTMTLTNNTGTSPVDLRPGSLVRIAHAYLDAKHHVSLDVVYQDGMAFEYDSTGGKFIHDNVLDMSHVIGRRKGQFQFDLLLSTAAVYSSGPDLEGTLVETTDSGTTTIGSNVRWISNFLDAKGKPGLYMGAIDGSGNLVVTRKDSIGTTTVYTSPDGATQDITDVSEARRGSNVVIDLTFGRFAGTYALQVSRAGVIALGNGTDILVGG
jgi:hypothetical protein